MKSFFLLLFVISVLFCCQVVIKKPGSLPQDGPEATKPPTEEPTTDSPTHPPTSVPNPLSAKGDIISFTMESISGEAIIDSSAKTVTAKVYPMDLSDHEPSLSVSPGAVLSSQPPLIDGKPVNYIVTAEDGTTTNWTVTVNVLYGFSMLGDKKTKIILTSGVIHSKDKEAHTRLGEGRAPAYKVTKEFSSILHMIAFTGHIDMANPATPKEPYLQMTIDKADKGSFSNASIGGKGYIVKKDVYRPSSKEEFIIEITEFGALEADIKGKISGVFVNVKDEEDFIKIKQGYFKLFRIAEPEFELPL